VQHPDSSAISSQVLAAPSPDGTSDLPGMAGTGLRPSTARTERAIKAYERSLELNPANTAGAEALKRLRGPGSPRPHSATVIRLTCPQCVSPYRRGATVFASCEATLPDPSIADRLAPGVRSDHQCPHCTTPFRDEDYRPDAEQISC
jgi:hypothetical protein